MVSIYTSLSLYTKVIINTAAHTTEYALAIVNIDLTIINSGDTVKQI